MTPWVAEVAVVAVSKSSQQNSENLISRCVVERRYKNLSAELKLLLPLLPTRKEVMPMIVFTDAEGPGQISVTKNTYSGQGLSRAKIRIQTGY